MLKELVRRRANSDGIQTIAHDLLIARNTVKSRLKDVGAYDIEYPFRKSALKEIYFFTGEEDSFCKLSL
ncbi:MAG: hypothetical protein HQK52_21525 [Oligoflexia bacterium]|nr:hypothetical protein [Oligoflexia bacterium]